MNMNDNAVRDRQLRLSAQEVSVIVPAYNKQAFIATALDRIKQ
jgi:hypothetical protein